MAEIGVARAGGEGRVFRVTVREGGAETVHEVTVTEGEMAFAGGATPETLVEKSFEFLLEREPKESILRRFELSVISRYFPEYEAEMRRRLAGSG